MTASDVSFFYTLTITSTFSFIRPFINFNKII